MTSVTNTLCVTPLLLPLNLILKVPVEADVVTFIVPVAVAVPPPVSVTEEGLTLPVTPEGNERAASDNVPVKPLSDVTVTV